jgi:hypothetical protein
MNLNEYIAQELEKLRYMNNLDRIKAIDSLYSELENTGHNREEIFLLINKIITSNLNKALNTLKELTDEL